MRARGLSEYFGELSWLGLDPALEQFSLFAQDGDLAVFRVDIDANMIDTGPPRLCGFDRVCSVRGRLYATTLSEGVSRFIRSILGR